jgi:hypothetical protein
MIEFEDGLPVLALSTFTLCCNRGMLMDMLKGIHGKIHGIWKYEWESSRDLSGNVNAKVIGK